MRSRNPLVLLAALVVAAMPLIAAEPAVESIKPTELEGLLLARELERIGFCTSLQSMSTGCPNPKVARLLSWCIDSFAKEAVKHIEAGAVFASPAIALPNLATSVDRALAQLRGHEPEVAATIRNLERVQVFLRAQDGSGASKTPQRP
jgi:hypothetical protein